MRIVVKIGSSSLVDARGQRQVGLIGAIVDDIARVVGDGHQVVLVSSGAIATGLGILGREARPSELPALQAASAVGQGALFATWSDLLRLRGLHAGQVLLTMHDAAHRATWANARATLNELLAWGVVPIVNENDTTATDEITFGDNDALAAQVAVALQADKLLLLTDTDGLYTEHPDAPSAELIDVVTDHSLLHRIDTATSGSHWGSGGMRSKVVAAEMAGAGAIVTHIAKAGAPNVVSQIVAGTPAVGTRIEPGARRGNSFQLWLRHAKRVRGTLLVDGGARDAVQQRGASLLPVGVVDVQGAFEPGDAVDVACVEDGIPFARGIAQYGTAELTRLTSNRDGARGAAEAIHRDQLVLVSEGS